MMMDIPIPLPNPIVLPVNCPEPYDGVVFDGIGSPLLTLAPPYHSPESADYIARCINAHEEMLAVINDTIEFLATEKDANDPLTMALLSRLAIVARDAEEPARVPVTLGGLADGDT